MGLSIGLFPCDFLTFLFIMNMVIKLLATDVLYLEHMVCHSTAFAVQPTHQLWSLPEDVSHDTADQEQSRKLVIAFLKQQTDVLMHRDAPACLLAYIPVSGSAWQMYVPPEKC